MMSFTIENNEYLFQETEVITTSPRIGPDYQADIPNLLSRKSKGLGKQSDHADRCHVEPFQFQFGVRLPNYAMEKPGYTMDEALPQSTSSEMEITDSQIDTNKPDNTVIRCLESSTIPQIARVCSRSRVGVPLPGSRLIDTGGLILPSSLFYGSERNYSKDYCFSPVNIQIEYFQTETFGVVEICHILPLYEAIP